jgi:hypothetical protein
MPATLNGRPPVQRRQLADQLDRLDRILDGLADALNDAVADAARIAARAAVLEALAAADRRAPASPPAPPTPSLGTRLKAALTCLRDRVADLARRGYESVRRRVRDAVPAVAAGVNLAAVAWRLRHLALLALTAGVAGALVSYAGPRPVAAALGGLGGAASALAVRGTLWLRATARHLTPA